MNQSKQTSERCIMALTSKVKLTESAGGKGRLHSGKSLSRIDHEKETCCDFHLIFIEQATRSTQRWGNTASTGSLSISLSGSGFSMTSYTSVARSGSSACEASEWMSETSLQCRCIHGGKKSRRVSITAGAKLGSISAYITFDTPTLSVWRRTNRANTGSASMSVHGAGLGLVAYTSMGREGQTG